MTILIASVWQGLAIALATELFLRGAPRLNATTRYMVWWMALAAVLALPIAHILLATEPGPLPVTAAAPAAHQGIVLPTPPDWLISCAAGAWLGTVLIGLARISRGLATVAALKRQARLLDPSIVRRLTLWNSMKPRVGAAELRVSRDIAGACALGLFGAPVIVLSERLIATLDDDTIDQIVLHEQAHLSRYDDWSTLAQSIVRALFGLHPAVRIIDRRIDLEREARCDDVVVMSTGAASRYARCLARAAEAVAQESGALAFMAPRATGRGGLLVRVQRLLDPRVPRHGRLQPRAAAIGLLAFVVAAAAAPAAPVVMVGDAIAWLPAVHGEPTRQTFDWQPRATPLPELPIDREPVRPAVESVNELPGAAPEAQTAAHQEAAHFPEPVTLTIERSDEELRSSAVVPLQSRALTSAAMPNAARFTDDSGIGWSTAGQAGAAIGDGFAWMGTATGATGKRAGIAVGGFFSRAGRAVAGSF